MYLPQKFKLNVSKSRENPVFPNLVSEPWLSGLEARASRSGAPATLMGGELRQLKSADDSEEEEDNSYLMNFIRTKLSEHGPVDDALVVYCLETHPEVWINAKFSASQEFALKYDEKASEEGRIPAEYQEFADVFDEKKADRLPASRTWDHKIEMKPGFEPKSFKAYNLSPEERQMQEDFVKEHLKKGYI